MSESVFHPEQFTAPKAEKKPHQLRAANGDARIDDYYWLNQRDNPAVRAYLEAENRYADSVLAPVANLQQALFDEMKARIQQDDNTVPYLKNGYWYYTRFAQGQEYPIFCRKKGSLEAPEQVMLDVNALAKGQEYCLATGLEVSPDNRLLFYVVDFSGRNLFEGRILDLETGRILPDRFTGIPAGGAAWANDNQHLFYETKDAATLRTNQIWRHRLGGDGKSEALVFEEKDETLYLSLSKSKSGRYIFLHHGYTDNLETHFLDAGAPLAGFHIFRPKEPGFYYTVDHWNDKFLIRTNWQARNFRLLETPVTQPGPEHWTELLPHRPEVLLQGFEVFKDYLVIAERKNGLDQLRIIRWADRQEHYLDFGEPTYSAGPVQNAEFDTPVLRYRFSSLKTPGSIFDYDMGSRQKTLRKTEPVLGGFDPANYSTEFIRAQTADGVAVPISLAYRRGLKRDGSAPCLLIGYGSYGFAYDPSFNREALSLLDRGFVVAIAHVRGGTEMGYGWYE
ncbi:MAG: S9 family peptidase, partial [Saprospiraceae bacterium]|nr:S9 family peptidase [Saprospiraceae bacterium]